ncbi:MAG TPA: hypothetical protein VK211_20450, partial [Kamptonema sp.]|nr:hypothetical protein [Kamptonema sp.]
GDREDGEDGEDGENYLTPQTQNCAGVAKAQALAQNGCEKQSLLSHLPVSPSPPSPLPPHPPPSPP